MATRTTLRRSIGVRMGQPFFRRFGGGAGAASGSGTTTTLIDTVLLKEVDNYWRGSFIYLPATGEVREISAFTNSSSTVTWLAAIASATSASDAYEIWSQITPGEVHEAINRAIRTAWPHFFLYGSQTTGCVINDENGLVYTLPTTNTIRRLCEVYLVVYDSTTGSVTDTGTNVQVKDTGASFVAADVGKYIAVYADDDTCVGEVRQISAVDSSTQVTVSTAFSDVLDVGANYRMLDFNDVNARIIMLTDYVTDAEVNPTTIWFGDHLTGYEGYPLKVVYEYEHPELTGEASTTTLDEEYIYNEAMAYLYSLKLASAPAAEVSNWEALAKYYMEQSDRYREVYKMRHKPSTIQRHATGLSGYSSDYPFRY